MLFLLLAACFPTGPTFVSNADIDRAIGRADFDTLCAGLTQKSEETRSYAAEKLKDLDAKEAGCTCDHLTYDGKWDAAVLKGLKGSKRDDRAGCAAKLLDDPAQPDRAGLAKALLDLKAPAVRSRLVTAATGDADPAVQAAAVPVFTNTKDAAELKLIADRFPTADVAWATAAAGVLAGQAEAAPILRQAATAHADPSVRTAALEAYLATKPADLGEVVCKVVLEDAAADVRAAAIRMVKSSRDDAVWACMRTRATTPEADGVVRKAFLETLKGAAHPEAAKILCDAIPFWVRSYVGETAVEPQSDLDIVYYQNSRDFERSYDCVGAAVKAGGYSCWGKAYLGAYFKELGGKASYPKCGPQSGAGAITFGD